MRVYRVAQAHDLTKGPYGVTFTLALEEFNDRNESWWSDEDFEYHSEFDCYSLGSRRPVPCVDGMEDIDCDQYFGFASIEHLLRWFPPEDLEKLEELGYAVFEVEVEEQFVNHGCSQVAFDIDAMDIVRKYNPTEVS